MDAARLLCVLSHSDHTQPLYYPTLDFGDFPISPYRLSSRRSAPSSVEGSHARTFLYSNCPLAKYSSKMPDLLSGNTPNVFSDRFAGGALMDLGIYPIYAAVRLFGKALDATYQAQQLDNTIDLNGDGILSYPGYQVHIKAGKNITSNLPCEIYTTDGTLTLNTIEHVRSAIFTDHQGNETHLPIQQAPHTMTEEVAAFANMIKQPNLELYQAWLDDATHVHKLLYTMRQTAGIRFEEEK